METTVGVRQSGFIVQQQTIFSTPKILTRTHRLRERRRGPQGTLTRTRYRYNQIGPLDHKMADNCVSLARTNTVSSTITN